jgi:hypothetical protein
MSTIASEALRSRLRITCWSWTPVAGDVREVVGELRLKHDLVSLKLTPRQRNNLSRDFVQIDRLERELLLAEQSA